MKIKGFSLKIAYLVFTMLVMTVALLGSTYAWFITTSVSGTNRIVVNTDNIDIKLLISANKDDFAGATNEGAITTIAGSGSSMLNPVSTANLTDFVYGYIDVDKNSAAEFRHLDTENSIYHGRIFLRANAENAPEGATLKVYLDERTESGGDLIQSKNDALMYSGRMGIMVDGKLTKIFRMRDTNPNALEDQNVTELDGVRLKADEVIGYVNNSPVIAKDPSVLFNGFTLKDEQDFSEISANSLFTMNLNQTYTVDVYFYLEGCDPDCTEDLKMAELDMHLAFYGIMSEGGAENE